MLIELFVTASISLLLALILLFHAAFLQFSDKNAFLVVVSTLWWTFGISIVFEGNSVLLRY